jgi:hypothetical protein
MCTTFHQCVSLLQTPTPHPQGYCVPRACVSRGPLDIHFRIGSPQQKRSASLPGTMPRYSKTHMDHDLYREQGFKPTSGFCTCDCHKLGSGAVPVATLQSTSNSDMSMDAHRSTARSTVPGSCCNSGHKYCGQVSNCDRTSQSVTPRLQLFAISADSVRCKAPGSTLESLKLCNQVRTNACVGLQDVDMQMEGTPVVLVACGNLPVITDSTSIDRYKGRHRTPEQVAGNMGMSTTPAVTALRRLSPSLQEAPQKVAGSLRRPSWPPDRCARNTHSAPDNCMNERGNGKFASDGCQHSRVASLLFLGSDSEFCGGPGAKRQKCGADSLASQSLKAVCAAESCPTGQPAQQGIPARLQN